MLAAGIHPATGTPVDHDHQCAACDHFLILRHAGAPAWFKCENHRGGTHGADTDIRQGWPACAEFVQTVTVRSFADSASSRS